MKVAVNEPAQALVVARKSETKASWQATLIKRRVTEAKKLSAAGTMTEDKSILLQSLITKEADNLQTTFIELRSEGKGEVVLATAAELAPLLPDVPLVAKTDESAMPLDSEDTIEGEINAENTDQVSETGESTSRLEVQPGTAEEEFDTGLQNVLLRTKMLITSEAKKAADETGSSNPSSELPDENELVEAPKELPAEKNPNIQPASATIREKTDSETPIITDSKPVTAAPETEADTAEATR